jgi:hypothetical protein
VQARLNNRQAIAKNIENLIGSSRAKLINKLSRRNVSKHLYLTTRYNLPIVYDGVAMVEVGKVKRVWDKTKGLPEIASLSSSLTEAGYRNLYNPYIEVIK